MELQVLDNFLNKDEFLQVKSLLTSNFFPWYKTKVLYGQDLNCSEDNNLQFVNVLYNQNTFVGSNNDFLNYFVYRIPIRSLLKVKVNLTFKTSKIVEHGFHTDFEYGDSMTAVYYVNSNDGYTIFEDGTKVESIENRLCIFKSNTSHSGTTCTNSDCRIVINFNYF
jgi:hypothetical protein